MAEAVSRRPRLGLSSRRRTASLVGAAAVVDGSLEREECWGVGGERGGAGGSSRRNRRVQGEISRVNPGDAEHRARESGRVPARCGPR